MRCFSAILFCTVAIWAVGCGGDDGSAVSIPVSGAFVEGTLTSELAAGEPRVVSILQVGPRGMNGLVPVVLRNNTDGSVFDLRLEAIAIGPDGEELAGGDDWNTHPASIPAGDLTFGAIDFRTDDAFPAGTAYDVSATWEVGEGSGPSGLSLQIVELERSNNRISGRVQNQTGKTVLAPIEGKVICFDGDGTTVAALQGIIDVDEISNDHTSSLSIDVEGQTCPQFLVGAQGYGLFD